MAQNLLLPIAGMIATVTETECLYVAWVNLMVSGLEEPEPGRPQNALSPLEEIINVEDPEPDQRA